MSEKTGKQRKSSATVLVHPFIKKQIRIIYDLGQRRIFRIFIICSGRYIRNRGIIKDSHVIFLIKTRVFIMPLVATYPQMVGQSFKPILNDRILLLDLNGSVLLI